MTNFTPELVEKAKAAQTAEQLLELAKATGVEMTAAEAATYFAQLNPKSGELDDDDLDNVAGGACSSDSQLPANGATVRVTSGQTCPKCGTNIGQYVPSGYSTPEAFIVCDNCSRIIAYLDQCTYEIIG